MASPPLDQPFILLAIVISASLIILSGAAYFVCYHLYKSRIAASSPPSTDLRKFSYRELKNATGNFSADNCIGKGGSAAVFRGILRDGKLVAVKLLDTNLPQSEQEFQSELRILAAIKPSALIVSLRGFCAEKDKRLLVFEYVPNGSLQESLLLDSRSSNSFDSALNWGLRFRIILDVAGALRFLHLDCDPAVLHGDVKPSNVLLDSEFRAKLSDFGLSRFKTEGETETETETGVDLFSQELSGNLNSATPEKGEVDFASALQASNASKNHTVAMGLSVDFNFHSESGNKGKEMYEEWSKVMPLDDELSSLENSKELSTINEKQWGKDWWWRQDGSGELCSKEYVSEWIGNQSSPISDIPDWDEEKGPRTSNTPKSLEKREIPTLENRLKCVDNGVQRFPPKKRLKMHEWWREENLDEIRKKGNKAKRVQVPHFGLGKYFEFRQIGRKSGQNDMINYGEGQRKNQKQKQQMHSTVSEMWSGDLFSRELSSTTSMRGTLCYVAPENGFGYLMEKADIYSLGVLILVIVSGRRPLHVLASPMGHEKANLISWARSLACSGGCVLELVDERMKGEYSKEEVGLCINLALACLQRVPEMRPDIGDVVRVLRGEIEVPKAQFEFSPSPPSRAFSKRRRGNGGLD